MISEKEKIEFNYTVYETNKIVGRKRESEMVWLIYWKNPLICRTTDCQEMTHMTRSFDLKALRKIIGLPDDGQRMYIPICKKHYQEAHALLVAETGRIERESRERKRG
jgi:hypothetical protein